MIIHLSRAEGTFVHISLLSNEIYPQKSGMIYVFLSLQEINTNMRYLPIFFSILIICLLSACKTKQVAQTTAAQQFSCAFYNVENLFDTLNHPVKFDDEFTPTGEKKWNTERYFKKLNSLAKVIEGLGFPTLIGLSEVENNAVLKDLVARPLLKNYNYGIVHYDSPDMRGIDVAFLYQKKHFEVLNSDKIRIPFPDEIEKGYTSRDILEINGKLSGQPLNLFINHWPSRRGGLEASQPKRVHVANYLKNRVDEIAKKNPEANIIITGDFNDETDNKSVVETLSCSTNQDKVSLLYNVSAAKDQAGLGTYNYRGNWNMLDQFIVSKALLKTGSIKAGELTIFKEDWILYNSKKYGPTPNRTYGGPNYYGGYSDHLPIKLDLMVY